MASSEEIKEGGSGAGAGAVCHPEAEGSLEATGCSSWTLDPGGPSPVCLLGYGEQPRAEANTYCAGVTVSQSSLPGSVCLSTGSGSDSADGFVPVSSFSECSEVIVTPYPGGRREPCCHELCTRRTFVHVGTKRACDRSES